MRCNRLESLNFKIRKRNELVGSTRLINTISDKNNIVFFQYSEITNSYQLMILISILKKVIYDESCEIPSFTMKNN